MHSGKASHLGWARNIPSWQNVRSQALFWTALLGLLGLQPADAQYFDSLDTYPPRWHLDGSNCDAQILTQKHLPEGGADGNGCEQVTFSAGHGSEVFLVYRIEPTSVLDQLTANVSVMSARPGAQIGLRVRFPYARDEASGQPIAVVLYGADYDDPGRFDSIGIGMIERPLRLKQIAVRREFGSNVDLRDPYVDAVVINAYSGPGKTAIRIDSLSIDGMVPVAESSTSMRTKPDRGDQLSLRVPNTSVVEESESIRQNAFPIDRVIRVLQYNDEPLNWVRSLGFDAVLLSKPPTAKILREAIQNRMLLYCPPPSNLDPSLESLLEPVAAWYVGAGLAMDSGQLQSIAASCQRIRQMPSRWKRPILGSPVENLAEYASVLHAVIDDLPSRARNLSADEEVTELITARRQVGSRIETAIGIQTVPSIAADRQTQQIATAIGAPMPSFCYWHGMWAQAMRALESAPRAVVFRSPRSLASGNPADASRAISLSYVSRMIAMIEPWLVEASPVAPVLINNGAFRCGRLRSGQTDLLIVSSNATRGTEVLAGDGDSLDLVLSPEDSSKLAWRLTHFSAERINAESSQDGPKLQIISPDVVEIIVLSSDPAMGGKLHQSAQRFARQASLDRWQLCNELIKTTRNDWELAKAMRAIAGTPSSGVLSVAEKTLVEAEPLFRAGDIDATLRMARRADAWGLRSNWNLTESLMPDWPHPTSCPPIVCHATAAQVSWMPLMGDAGWGANRLTSGSLDSQHMISDGRWGVERRLASRADTQVGLTSRGVFDGEAALKVAVTSNADDPLPGGYEGTIVQVASPSIRIPAGKAFRVDAMIRTLGFGGPHQGILVYETTAGQELGVLVRGRSDWTPVRLYRQTSVESEVKVMFEVIGGGEATIDEVRLQIWEPAPIESGPLLRPIGS